MRHPPANFYETVPPAGAFPRICGIWIVPAVPGLRGELGVEFACRGASRIVNRHADPIQRRDGSRDRLTSLLFKPFQNGATDRFDERTDIPFEQFGVHFSPLLHDDPLRGLPPTGGNHRTASPPLLPFLANLPQNRPIKKPTPTLLTST